jgi:hypothetical protein
MSWKKIELVRYKCTCELDTCTGVDPAGKHIPWVSNDGEIPKRCRWCKSYNWNGKRPDRRKERKGKQLAIVAKARK